jgi:beta-glucosidase
MELFPKDFFWGTAISSYQTEGNTFKADWWDWERHHPPQDNSQCGQACDFWNRYEFYIAKAAELGSRAFRFSLEWSRIQPTPDTWDEHALSQYSEIIQTIKSHQMEPVVTLWHFSLPLWFAQLGGWTKAHNRGYWNAYCEKIKDTLGKEVNYWLTLNEPSGYAANGYLTGLWPPGKHSPWNFLATMRHLILAHKNAYAILKTPVNHISLSLNLSYDELVHPKNWLERLFLIAWQHYSDWGFLSYVKNKIDFLGINYYFHNQISLIPGQKRRRHLNKSDTDWDICPQGLYRVIKEAYQQCRQPIFITENGLADAYDSIRPSFIREHIQWLHEAYTQGLPIIGYLYWSLMDNVEWQRGKQPRFGLMAMDYENLMATPRPSYYFYQDIIRAYTDRA